MAASLTVLCAVRGPAETDVVLALGATGSGVTVTRRCGDVAELMAAAAAGAGAVAVVSADLPGLDREVVARLHADGVRLVALGEPAVPTDRLRALGVDVVVERFDEAVVLAAVRDAAPSASAAGMLLGHGGEGREPESRDPSDAPAAQGPEGPGDRRGHVVAVWGPVGAPGRTTTATELAASLAGLGTRAGRRGRRRRAATPRATETVLLVDADTYGASVAARLGLLDDAPGLAAASRAAAQGTLDLPTLARHSPVVGGRLRVLTGITRAARWPELSASALEVVLDRSRELADWTVVDCGAVLESDELLMYDTHAPQRNAATLAALQAADVVVVVGAADPVGIQRLVRGLEDLAEVPVPVAASRVVVANRVRSSAVGPHPEAAVLDALARYAGVDDAHVVPDDPASLDAALLVGRTLAEHAPGSPVAGALDGLADRVRELVAAALTADSGEPAAAAVVA
ncbi:P-loop NTPase [Isoptericola hypogeus]|uniref:P-loop NTPase n=1 Tax=Isoptericola hypogeus TaxID=300179 RepID=A0ABN2IQK1_9MICO